MSDRFESEATAEYISALSLEMAELADRAGLLDLRYLIGLVILEARGHVKAQTGVRRGRRSAHPHQ
jgi:hypothetical protein